MKKILAMVLTAMMMLSLCSLAVADEAVELELVFHKPEANAIDALQKVVDAFNAENPGIKVNMIQVPDTSTVLQTRAQLNEMPDMFTCTTSNMYELMFDDGIIMDLTGQEFLNNAEASTLELSTYKARGADRRGRGRGQAAGH